MAVRVAAGFALASSVFAVSIDDVELLNVHSESERYLSVFLSVVLCSPALMFVQCLFSVQTVCWPIFGKIMGFEAKICSHRQRGVSN